jgi:acetylornithine deacetylase/succinyl-diaminopimelate desuccinylase-like protein
MAIDSLYSFQHGWLETTRSLHCFETLVVFSPVVDIQDVKRDRESTLHGTAQIGVEIEILYRGFHAQGAVLLPEYIDGVKDDTEHGDKSLQRGFIEFLQSCHSVAVAQSNVLAKSLIAVLVTQELHLLSITCTTDAGISIHRNHEEVVVTCYGPDASNIHSIDESASLESMRVVTAAIALFIRDWCGLEKCSD